MGLTITARTLTAAFALALGGRALAGPLVPPAGPIKATFKTLAEVQPRTIINATNTPGDAEYEFVIAQPGSYYFAGQMNIGGVKHAVKIAADNVSIDMNGFAMVCTAPSTGTAFSTANLPRVNISIANGAIRGGFQGAVVLLGTGHRAERLNIQNTFGDAINLQAQATVRDCTATANSGIGIVCGSQATISGCTVQGNAMGGISAGPATALSSSSAVSNVVGGILVANNCSVIGCLAVTNAGPGISGGFTCVVKDCVSNDNTGDGIATSAACTISGCAVSFNNGNGFNIENGTLITASAANANTLDGIRASFGTHILHNNCDQNGTGGSGAGIHITGNDNRIEGNNCTQADRGVEVGGSGNIIVRNTCASNTTDWVFVPNNAFGPIVDRRAPASASVSGFSAVSTLASTDPNTNFSF